MSDHFSGPAVMGDPSVDITDFYAFPSPERRGNIVLIMNVFPMATPQALFSDAVTYRFRLRPLAHTADKIAHGEAEYTIDIGFDDVPESASIQKGKLVTSDGREMRFVVGEPIEMDGLRLFAGLVSDPFFMDVEATIRTDMSGKLSFDTGTNTVAFRDVLSLVVELPFASIVEHFNGTALVGAIAENVVTRRGRPIRIERVGRPEIKNVLMANAARDPSGVELRDLYNKEDAFALSREYRPLYEARINASLAFLDGLDGETEWPLGPEGRHALCDLLMNDYLVLDLARDFVPSSFLEIERSLIDGHPHTSCGGRWLDDDILDDMLTLFVNGGKKRLGDGVDAPTKPASLRFPYVREPNKRCELPLPAFLTP
jgi:hypothetical protein